MKSLNLAEIEYVVFDLETTGLYPDDGDEIIEIGAILIDNCTITDKQFHAMVNPQRTIPAASIAVHGIKNEDVAKAPFIDKVLPEFMNFVGNRVWIAQNARFDLGFIVKKLLQFHLPLRQTVVIDTIGISKMLFPYEPSHSLDVLMARLGIARSGDRHRSIDDSKYAGLVFLEFVKLLAQQGITSLPQIESSFIRSENLVKVEKPKTRSLFG